MVPFNLILVKNHVLKVFLFPFLSFQIFAHHRIRHYISRNHRVFLSDIPRLYIR